MFTELLLIFFVLVCVGILLKLLHTPERVYQFPYLVNLAFIGFILPQTFILYNNKFTLPQGSFELLIIMCLLCLIMSFIGYSYPDNKRGTFNFMNSDVSLNKIYLFGIIYTLIGFIFFLILVNIPDQRQPTGIYTIFRFFSDIIYFGFAVCLLCFFKCKGSKKYFIAIFVLLGAVVPIYRTLFEGKREQTAFFFIIISMILYYEKGFTPSRLILLLAFIIGTVAIPLTSEYRTNLALTDPIDALTSIKITNVLEDYVQNGNSLELRNAAYIINFKEATGKYNWGGDYWNTLIFRYFPAQLFGKTFKESFYLSERTNAIFYIPDPNKDIVYDKPPGTTFTGIGDSFVEFSYLGCLVFFLISSFYKRLWTNSKRAENPILFQILYIQMSILGIRTVTHGTVDFLPGMIYNFILIYIIYLFCKQTIILKKIYHD